MDYQIHGVYYCQSCVECEESPCLSGEERERATRADGIGCCGCCGERFGQANDGTTDPADPTFLALCADIDAGDDTALSILADRLEEICDPRADGLRYINPYQRFPHKCHSGTFAWVYESSDAAQCWPESALPSPTFTSLACPGRLIDQTSSWREYPTRSAAYLALAEAIVEVAHA